jgi:hypothetical protein
MRVSGQITKDLLGSAKRTFRVDNPVRGNCRVQQLLESRRLSEFGALTKKLQLTGGKSLLQKINELSAKDPTENLLVDVERFSGTCLSSGNPA